MDLATAVAARESLSSTARDAFDAPPPPRARDCRPIQRRPDVELVTIKPARPGGARRDEEKSRSKERVFSSRTASHGWDPKSQRPELWSLFNTRVRSGESLRVFPLSNWTELDIWQYIRAENIPIVPLYFSAERPVVERDGQLIMVDDDRMPLRDGEIPQMRRVRFRTLGCYPLTSAIESGADTLDSIVTEMLVARTSERSGRMIDHDDAASMEKKKREGYF